MKTKKNKITFWRDLQFWANIIAFFSLFATVSYSFYFSQKMSLISDRSTFVSLFRDLLKVQRQIRVINIDLEGKSADIQEYRVQIAEVHEEIKLILSEIENIRKNIDPKITYLQYRILAESYGVVGDYKNEKACWEHGINDPDCPNRIRVEYLRSYGSYFYRHSLIKEGADIYQKALDTNSDTTEYGRYINGVTYCDWGQMEYYFGKNKKQAAQIVYEASKIFKTIQDSSMYKSGMEHAYSVLKRITNN